MPLKTCPQCKNRKPLTEFYQRKDSYFRQCKTCAKKNAQAWFKSNPVKAAAIRRRYRFGLSVREQNALLSGPCPICGCDKTTIDHSHATGKIRDGLCRSCNSGLGMFQDSPALLTNAANYLTRHL